MDDSNDGLEDDGDFELSPQEAVLCLAGQDAWEKNAYLLFVQMITQAHGSSRALYDAVIAKVKKFDPDFAEKLTAIQNAEDEAVRYAKARLEGKTAH